MEDSIITINTSEKNLRSVKDAVFDLDRAGAQEAVAAIINDDGNYNIPVDNVNASSITLRSGDTTVIRVSALIGAEDRYFIICKEGEQHVGESAGNSGRATG